MYAVYCIHTLRRHFIYMANCCRTMMNVQAHALMSLKCRQWTHTNVNDYAYKRGRENGLWHSVKWMWNHLKEKYKPKKDIVEGANCRQRLPINYEDDDGDSSSNNNKSSINSANWCQREEYTVESVQQCRAAGSKKYIQSTWLRLEGTLNFSLASKLYEASHRKFQPKSLTDAHSRNTKLFSIR